MASTKTRTSWLRRFAARLLWNRLATREISATIYRDCLADWQTDLGPPKTGSIMLSLIAEARRDPQMASVFTRFAIERFGLIRSILERAIERGELKADADSEQMTEDLVAPLLFRAFIRSTLMDRASVDDHIDRWIGAYAR